MMKLSKNITEFYSYASYVLSADIIGKMANFLVGIVSAKILGPTNFGIIIIINTVIRYINYTNLGLMNSMSREIPIAYGMGNKDLVKEIVSTTANSYILITLASSIIIFFIVVGDYFPLDGIEGYTAYFAYAILITNNADTYYYNYLKAEGQFIAIGKLQFIKRLFTPFVNLAMIYVFGLQGALIVISLSHLIIPAYVIINKMHSSIKLAIDHKLLKSILSTGIPMHANKIISGIVGSIAVIILAKFSTSEAVGIFAFTTSIFISAKVPMASAFSITLTRNVMLQTGKNSDFSPELFTKYYKKPLIMYSMLYTTVIGAMIIAYQLVINEYLTMYDRSMVLMMFLFIPMSAYSNSKILNGYINASKQMPKRIAVLLIGICIYFIGAYICRNQENSLVSITILSAVVYMFIAYALKIPFLKQIYTRISEVYSVLLGIIIIYLLQMILIYGHYYLYYEYISNYEFLYLKITATAFYVLIYVMSTISLYIMIYKEHLIHKEIKNAFTWLIERVKTKISLKENDGSIG